MIYSGILLNILIVYLIIYILFISMFARIDYFNNNFIHSIMFWPLLISLGILFGWSPEEDFTDTATYTWFFENYQDLTFSETLSISPMEKGFTAFQWLISQFTSNPSIYFFLVFIGSFFFIFLSFKKIFLNNYLFAVLAYICTPLFISMSGNVIRTGFAFGIFLLGSIYIFQQDKVKGGIWLLISCMFHTTLLPFALVLIIFNPNKYKFNVFIIASIISALLFLTNTQTTLFPFITDFDKLDMYSSEDFFQVYGNSGIRVDFFLFNVLLISFLFIANKYFFNYKNQRINYYLKLTLIASVVFHLLGFIAFSDRLALYVWLLFLITLFIMVIEKNRDYPLILPAYLILSLLISITSKSYLFFN